MQISTINTWGLMPFRLINKLAPETIKIRRAHFSSIYIPFVKVRLAKKVSNSKFCGPGARLTDIF